jgi:flagellar biosynthesis protein FlhG
MVSTDNVPNSVEPRRIVAIGSGKGGMGASMIATNLAVFLAQIGKRVVLVDANLPDAGLHSWLGIPRPLHTIIDVLNGNISSIEDVMVDSGVTGLSLVGGAETLHGGYNLSSNDHKKLLALFNSLETDFVLVDLPAGLHPLGLFLFGHADVPITVNLATPDAVEATYRFVKASFLTKLLTSTKIDPDTHSMLENLGLNTRKQPTAREVINVLNSNRSAFAETATRIAATFHPQFVVNQIKIKADEGLVESMIAATTRWIGIIPRLMGTIGWDDNVWLSLRRGTPLLIDFPQSLACRGLEQVMRRLLSQNYDELFAQALLPPPVDQQNLYELLEIYPGASEEEVRRALKLAHEYFGLGGLAVSGACTEDERQSFQRRSEEAHETLIDRSKRRAYDRATFPKGFPDTRERFEDGRAGVVGHVKSPHDSLPKVRLQDDQMVDGAFLGKIRRERGIELVDISNRAKISVSYLKGIEEERFDDLPEPVYVRGFVTEYARYLKIDPVRAVTDFMAVYDSATQQNKK